MIPEPTDEEKAHLERIARDVKERVEQAGFEAIIGGSYAKGTWLSGTRDIDVFARADVTSERELEKRIRILKDAFPEASTVRGSREYLRFEHESVTIEIIPIRPLSADANTMDHSPDHIAYVREHLKNPVEVRRLKALLKANRIYGAESYVRGFSGYVCELLIIRYETISELARNAAQWREGERVSFHETPKDFDDALIVEDPTDPDRNAAGAVERETLDAFIGLMRRIANNEPIESLMKPKTLEPPYARVRIRASHEKPDVGFSQLRSLHDRLVRELEPYGVTAAQWSIDTDVWESRYELERYELERETERLGPPLHMTSSVEKFRSEHPNAYEKDDRIAARVERDETRWEDVASRVLTHEHVASYECEVIR